MRPHRGGGGISRQAYLDVPIQAGVGCPSRVVETWPVPVDDADTTDAAEGDRPAVKGAAGAAEVGLMLVLVLVQVGAWWPVGGLLPPSSSHARSHTSPRTWGKWDRMEGRMGVKRVSSRGEVNVKWRSNTGK